jgi:O-antigen/teichoic acid export membrane protein
MMLSNYLLYFLAQRRFREPHVTPQAELATVLKGVWFHMTLAGMLVQAGPHLNRIVLRIFWDNEAVADLFAATGIVYLFVTPVSNSGALLLSMISKYNSVKEISRNTYRLILGMMVALGAGGMLFFYFLSPLMLRLLFPGFGNRAVGLFPILIWMIPANFVIAFVRPLITKFAKVAWIPTINFSVLLLIIVLMFSLVPKWGLIGAAYSICIGNVAEAVLRLVVFAMIYHGRQRDDQDDKGAETPPPSDARNLISRPADTCDA